MTADCAHCVPAPSVKGWKKFGAWAGAIFFCPCHLPLTIAGLLVMLSAAGVPIATSWGQPLLYAIFGVSFTFFAVLLLRWTIRRRDHERQQDAAHALHAPSDASAPSPAMAGAARSAPADEAA